ncbi:MAG: zinc ribbon domain-containing protein [Methanomassiliicoccales archaeon]|jgi:ribosomal protein L40E
MADIDATTILTFILLAALAVAVFFEVRFIRSRRKKGPDTSGIDEIYNQIITTRAISSTMKRKGNETRDADMLIIEAEAAYDRGNYQAARSAVERAKTALQQSKPMPAAIEEEPKHPVQRPDFERSGPDAPYIEPSFEVPFQTAKLPKDYCESKFLITSIRDETEKQRTAGNDVSQAETNLDQAQRLFDEEKYTESLKFAMKAKHSLEEPRKPAPPPPSEERVPKKVEEKGVDYCRKCNALVDESDTFCRRCGAKIDRIPRCANCGSEVSSDDVFCRKCGNQLRSLFSCPVCNAEVSENDERCAKCKTPLK